MVAIACPAGAASLGHRWGQLSGARLSGGWWLGGDEADDVDAAASSDFGEDVGGVGFDGAAGQEQGVRDLGVGLAVGDEAGDAGLCAGEAVPAGGGAAAGGTGSGADSVLAEAGADPVQVPGGGEFFVQGYRFH